MIFEIDLNCTLYCTCGRELKGSFEEEEYERGCYNLSIEPCVCRKGIRQAVAKAYQTGLNKGKEESFREGYDRGYTCATIARGGLR